MDQRSSDIRVGGTTVRVADIYIWSSISYLDSPSSYRECLPHKDDQELVFLDDQERFSWKFPLGVIGMVALCYVAVRLLMIAAPS